MSNARASTIYAVKRGSKDTFLAATFAVDDTLAAGGASKILVVEDDFLIAVEAEAALREAGFEVAGVAASAEEALELAATTKPALAVMDIRLLGKRDGIDTAIELFRDHGIRCIFASAHSDEQARKRATPAQPLGWLQKPYTMASLVEMVRAVVRSKS